jgi:phenylalanyl-tRNA synthetase beta chain
MQFSEKWLRALVDPPLGTDDLAHLLTMSGLEVEACEPVAPPFSGVVVGSVVEVARHPNADRLSLCTVDAGGGAALQIVCGAPNVRQGMKAPVALVGASLPGGLSIKRTAVRGIESNGMLCSARELGLSDDHSGLLALPPEAPVGAALRDYLELDDRVFTIKLTPNRADCLSVLGVAREVAALTGAILRPPAMPPVAPRIGDTLPVRIEAPDLCGRFSGRIVRNVNAGAPTPAWMRSRLERSGQRPISALVDISNYVMLELGRPSHIFDLDKVRGGLVVRWGRKGERAELLNGQTVDVDGDVGVICDDYGVEALAGIMGGAPTAVSDSTRNIYIEAAFWWPAAIAGRSRRFNFATEAGHRFERGVDFETTVAHIERITALILDICGGEPGPVTDQVTRLPERNPVRMRVARAQKVIGVPVPAAAMEDIFRRLALPARREGGGADECFVVTPPSYRFDIEIEEDLIEEVARLYGFDNIPAHPPVARAAMRVQPESERSLHELRAGLAAAGYEEVVNYSFVEADWERDFAGNADPIRLLNPIASQLAVMRTSLIGSLVANVRYNVNRKLTRVRVFEVGRVFLRAPGAPDADLEVAGIRQPVRIGAAAFGPALEEQWGVPARPVDFFDVKGDLEALIAPLPARFVPARHPALHPGRCARVEIGGVVAGWLGELHPAWQQKYDLPAPVIAFEIDAATLSRVPVPHYREVSKFPSVTRDLAVVVDEAVPARDLQEALEGALPELVRAVRLFDVYRGPNIEKRGKSLAFRVVMQHTARTLTDAEVDAAMAELEQLLSSRFGAKRRG